MKYFIIIMTFILDVGKLGIMLNKLYRILRYAIIMALSIFHFVLVIVLKQL